MSLLSKLFGGTSDTPNKVQPELHDGFQITPEPMKDGSQYRLAARIEKEVAGEMKSHHLIRADTFPDPDQAAKAALAKAKQLIDQMGDRLFK
jgi:hypothetical protein